MNHRHRSISVPVDTYVDVDIADLIAELNADDALEIARKHHLLGDGLGRGDGDDSRLRGIIEDAERALRRVPAIPRELADLMWHVHGRAIA